jgi:ferric-dicitrate binding protein FerR (iron transport regulator)
MQNAALSKWTKPFARETPTARAPSRSRVGPTTIVAAAILLSATASAGAQTSACELVPDVQNPPERILRCGDRLVIRTAHDTSYHPVDQNGTEQPNAVELDGGALMVEFHPSRNHPSFQIRTPFAIAAVRGTRWVVDVGSGKTSTFVIAGRVAVSRPSGEQTVLLHRGEGADVSPDSGPIVVKRWAAARVRALLARFGQ